MYKKLLALGLLCAMQSTTVSWADSYTDVEYLEGLPGFSSGPLTGRLHVEQTGITFDAGPGQEFQIPLMNIREQGHETTTKSSNPRGLVFAGPNPILMAATLGGSLVANALARPRKVSQYFYKLRFTGYDHLVHEVKFKVVDQSVQAALLDDVRNLNYNYNIVQEPAPQQIQPEMADMQATSPPPAESDSPVNVLLLNEGLQAD